MNPLLELIDNAGLGGSQESRMSAINRMTRSQINWIRAQAAELSRIENRTTEAASPFIQAASISPGGGRQPCSALQCRSKKLNELANYAALYADRVYVSNFLATRAFEDAPVSQARQLFDSDLTLFLEIRPLIDGDRIVPVTLSDNYCVHCLAKSALAEKSRAKIDRPTSGF